MIHPAAIPHVSAPRRSFQEAAHAIGLCFAFAVVSRSALTPRVMLTPCEFDAMHG